MYFFLALPKNLSPASNCLRMQQLVFSLALTDDNDSLSVFDMISRLVSFKAFKGLAHVLVIC